MNKSNKKKILIEKNTHRHPEHNIIIKLYLKKSILKWIFNESVKLKMWNIFWLCDNKKQEQETRRRKKYWESNKNYWMIKIDKFFFKYFLKHFSLAY